MHRAVSRSRSWFGWQKSLLAVGVTGFGGIFGAEYLYRRRLNNSSYRKYAAYLQRRNEAINVAGGLLAANLLVFAAWKLPFFSLREFLNKNFLLSSELSRPFQAIPAALSHNHALHFLGNAVSFGGSTFFLYQSLDREHYAAHFVSCALFSALGSRLFRIWKNDPALSLGASGVTMGQLASIAVLNPNGIREGHARFDARVALAIGITFDIFGLLFSFNRLDHAAHLFGAAGGALYSFSLLAFREHSRKIENYLSN
jgi:membrane associated rhomboid family serine protease